MKSKKNGKSELAAASRPARGAWVEIAGLSAMCATTPSRPARGAWVEIAREIVVLITNEVVAPRKGRVG